MDLETTISPAAESIARVCHEANRAHQLAFPSPGIAVAAPWDDCSAEQRESVVAGVDGVLRGLTPAQSHQQWCAFKLDRGWRYGEVKDEAAKTHPCLVPYDELDPLDRLKDGLFSGIVLAYRDGLDL